MQKLKAKLTPLIGTLIGISLMMLHLATSDLR